MLLDPRTGRHYPSPEWAKWRNQAVHQLWVQRGRLGTLFLDPVAIVVDYYPPDKRRRDATALLDALFHVMEHAGIVADDSLIKHIHWTEHPVDKMNPSLVFIIEKIE